MRSSLQRSTNRRQHPEEKDMAHPIPVTIFTGFLGSGKTTLLSSLIQEEREQRFAVVVNEFGEVSVDDILLQKATGDTFTRVFKLTRGLIAYAGDDFLETMRAINAEARLFDHVLIETSGLAVPTAVMEALQAPGLRDRFVHDATLAIVDTPLFLTGAYEAGGKHAGSTAQLAATGVFQNQLMCADVVVLNKIDQVEETELLRAEAAIRQRAPDVRFVELAWQARLDARLVLGLHLNEFRAHVHVTGMPATGEGQLHVNGHEHSGLGLHEHGMMTHEHLHVEDPGWLSFVLRSDEHQNTDALREALEQITEQEPVLRVKGFAHVEGATGHLLVQGVRTRIAYTMEPDATPHPHDPEPASTQRPAHRHEHGHDHRHHARAELVFIGYHLNRTRMVAKLCQHTGTAWG
jgi:cobalamin biosynthesis protein CobW